MKRAMEVTSRHVHHVCKTSVTSSDNACAGGGTASATSVATAAWCSDGSPVLRLSSPSNASPRLERFHTTTLLMEDANVPMQDCPVPPPPDAHVDDEEEEEKEPIQYPRAVRRRLDSCSSAFTAATAATSASTCTVTTATNSPLTNLACYSPEIQALCKKSHLMPVFPPTASSSPIMPSNSLMNSLSMEKHGSATDPANCNTNHQPRFDDTNSNKSMPSTTTLTWNPPSFGFTPSENIFPDAASAVVFGMSAFSSPAVVSSPPLWSGSSSWALADAASGGGVVPPPPSTAPPPRRRQRQPIKETIAGPSWRGGNLESDDDDDDDDDDDYHDHHLQEDDDDCSWTLPPATAVPRLSQSLPTKWNTDPLAASLGKICLRSPPQHLISRKENVPPISSSSNDDCTFMPITLHRRVSFDMLPTPAELAQAEQQHSQHTESSSGSGSGKESPWTIPSMVVAARRRWGGASSTPAGVMMGTGGRYLPPAAHRRTQQHNRHRRNTTQILGMP